MRGHVRIVGDEDDGVTLGMQVLEQRQHFLAGVRIERAGGFVRQDHLGAVHQRARNRHALLLSARQLIGTVLRAVAQAQAGEQGLRPLAAFTLVAAGIDRRQLHVLRGRDRGQQVVALEHEAEGVTPQRREFVRVQARHVHAAYLVAAFAGAIQAAQDVHQRGLAGAGLSDDGDELAGLDFQAHVVERTQQGVAAAVNAGNPVQFE